LRDLALYSARRSQIASTYEIDLIGDRPGEMQMMLNIYWHAKTVDQMRWKILSPLAIYAIRGDIGL
jgi:hypothetical protein